MKNIIRISIALVVFLSGVILVPAMGLPTDGFNWQRYAGVYEPTSLDINHASGAPGSFFTILGTNFSPKTTASIVANGSLLGDVDTSEDGDLLFLIDSTNAEDGYYIIEVRGDETAQIKLLIKTGDTLWPQEDSGPIFSLFASGVSPVELIFMPVIER